MFKVLRNGLLSCILHTCPKLWCNPCLKCYGMGCLAAYFTHVQSCDVTRVQSATQWTASVQTSHQDVMQYRGRLFTGRHVTSRQDVTCRSYRGQGASRHVTSRQDVTGAAVNKEAVTSRHVTSRASQRRGQGGRHVTSRQDITGAAVDKEAVTSPAWTRRTSRHVTSAPPRADHAQLTH